MSRVIIPVVPDNPWKSQETTDMCKEFVPYYIISNITAPHIISPYLFPSIRIPGKPSLFGRVNLVMPGPGPSAEPG